jgi:hypothetical protein
MDNKKGTPKVTPKKKKKEVAQKTKEPKATKGFTFVTKDDITYEVPKVRVQAKMIDGKAYCPVCGFRDYKVEDVDVVDIPFMLVSRGKCNICGCKIEYLFSTLITEKEKTPVNKEPIKVEEKVTTKKKRKGN